MWFHVQISDWFSKQDLKKLFLQFHRGIISKSIWTCVFLRGKRTLKIHLHSSMFWKFWLSSLSPVFLLTFFSTTCPLSWMWCPMAIFSRPLSESLSARRISLIWWCNILKFIDMEYLKWCALRHTILLGVILMCIMLHNVILWKKQSERLGFVVYYWQINTNRTTVTRLLIPSIVD